MKRDVRPYIYDARLEAVHVEVARYLAERGPDVPQVQHDRVLALTCLVLAYNHIVSAQAHVLSGGYPAFSGVGYDPPTIADTASFDSAAVEPSTGRRVYPDGVA